MKYIQLFFCFLKVGILSFGGGYASVSMIQEQVVTKMGWLSRQEFSDLVTISQITPGPIAVNSATFVGTKIAGMAGAAAATLGCILPSCLLLILIMALCVRYVEPKRIEKIWKALHPGALALIGKAGLDLLWQVVRGKELGGVEGMILICLCFALLLKKKCGPVGVILLSGAGGMLLSAGSRVFG